MKLNKVLILIVIILSANYLFAQSGNLEGRVVGQRDQQPLGFSTVSVFNAQDSTLIGGAVSDENGKFSIKNIPAGSYYAIVQRIGQRSKKIKDIILVRDQKLDLGAITLEDSQQLLDEVIVTGEKAAVYHLLDKQTYNASQFQASQGGNAIEVLRNLPSITVNSEGEILMRGSSGFIILLDGKAIQTDPLVILNQLPANTIENIEVITTPTSKYDPDGKAGIINITTKKGATDGYYILSNAQVGLPSIEDYGNEQRPVRFGGDVTTNIKKKKWDVSLSANYKRDDIAGYRDGQAKTYIGNVFTTSPSVGERSYKSYSYALRTTANYQINKRNSIEAGFYAGKKSQFRKANILYHQQRFNLTSDEVINSLDYFNKNLRERKGDFVVANTDYNHIFKNKGALSLSALYEKTILGGPTTNTDVNPEQQSIIYNNAEMQESNPLNGIRLKADYSLPVNEKGKFEAGYQYRYLLHKGDFVYNQFDPGTASWFVRDDLSNKIKLTRYIHSWYSQFTNEVGKLSYSAGLRLEYVDRSLVETSKNQLHNFRRLNLFPSANFIYDLEKGYKVKWGYSRRISHTTSNMMNPFPARRHSEVLEVGDPNLLPEYTDVAEAGVIKDLGNSSLFANAYYRNTKNVINRVNAIYNDTILVRTYTNAGNGTAFGLEAGADVNLTERLILFAGGNVYSYNIKGAVFNTGVNTHSINYSLNTNATFKIDPTLTLQLTVNYTSKTVTAQGEDSRFVIPTLTLKKILLKGQSSVTLQWQNIDLGLFGTNQQRITTEGQGFYTSTNYIQEVDIIRVSFSYQLHKLAKKLKFTESEFGEKEF